MVILAALMDIFPWKLSLFPPQHISGLLSVHNPCMVKGGGGGDRWGEVGKLIAAGKDERCIYSRNAYKGGLEY
jgi:hypothetical protein